MVDYLRNPPDASALMMSARSFGNYDLAGAIADLIDNSIKATASRISIWCYYNDGNPEVHVVDDGHGMSPKELQAAMRPASMNPKAERSPDDLGRFGWGMKSASFSQARCLTVISSKSGELAGATWDLDDLDDWKMAILKDQEIRKFCDPSLLNQSGTEIIWNKCDRLSEGKTLNQSTFNELIIHTRNQLGLIYHRYIAGTTHSKGKMELRVNDVAVSTFDPFHREHPATQALEEESLTIPGFGNVTIKPYILPHYSKLRSDELERLSGDEGLVKNQGFYIYRNDRLIMSGTWFRLMKHGELSQLVRISVDIPNSLDDMWKITIDKSDAQLPAALRRRLYQIVQGLKGRASRVQRSKGGRIDRRGKVEPVWKRYFSRGEIRYEINRDHPLIEPMLTSEKTGRMRAAENALKVIEREFPVDSFIKDGTDNVAAIHQSEANPAEFREFLDASVPYLLAQEEGDVDALIERLKVTEPYSTYWYVVEEYMNEEGWGDVEE